MEIRENAKIIEQIQEMENMMSNFAKEMKGSLETKTATIDDIETFIFMFCHIRKKCAPKNFIIFWITI